MDKHILTKREKEVFVLLVSNKTTKESYDRARKFYNYTSETKETHKAARRWHQNGIKTIQALSNESAFVVAEANVLCYNINGDGNGRIKK